MIETLGREPKGLSLQSKPRLLNGEVALAYPKVTSETSRVLLFLPKGCTHQQTTA